MTQWNVYREHMKFLAWFLDLSKLRFPRSRKMSTRVYWFPRFTTCISTFPKVHGKLGYDCILSSTFFYRIDFFNLPYKKSWSWKWWELVMVRVCWKIEAFAGSLITLYRNYFLRYGPGPKNDPLHEMMQQILRWFYGLIRWNLWFTDIRAHLKFTRKLSINLQPFSVTLLQQLYNPLQ